MTLEEFRDTIQTQQPRESCPVARTLDLLRGKWTCYLIYELQKKPTARFGELKKSIDGITNTMLSSTLKDLETLGIVERTQFNEIPPHVEYSLTPAGRDMLPIFFEMARWGSAYLPE